MIGQGCDRTVNTRGGRTSRAGRGGGKTRPTGACYRGENPRISAPARTLRAAGSDGIAYPSIRNPGGQCIAAFWPDVPALPVQARHLRYHRNGERIDMIRELKLDGSGKVYRLEGQEPKEAA